ncbi:MAG: sugar transferase [Spartobacteria bacterium]|nr:sugar transferase [Spartobacteria bacterium]
MNEMIYKVRMELFKELDMPVSKADARLLARRQRRRLLLWEVNLKSLYAIKRMMDVAASLVGLLLLSPVFLVVGLLIMLEDGRPVFYTQDRVGLNGVLFRFYKFRSMYRNADKMKAELSEQNESGDGVIFKMKKDPRVTRMGRFIRRYSIDEMPQFLNVLSGDLALVGPRPPLPKEVALYTLDERKRLHVKPGLTCLWQVQGRSDIPFKDQVRLDLKYIHSQSVWTDIKIILQTVPAVLLGKGAY